jgi:hypothetical protein
MNKVIFQERLVRSAVWLSAAALISSVFSPGIFPYVFAVFAILFGLLSRGRDRRYKRAARVGLIMACGALFINTAMLVYSYYNLYTILQDPVQREQLSQRIYEQTGLTLDDMLSQFRQYLR